MKRSAAIGTLLILISEFAFAYDPGNCDRYLTAADDLSTEVNGQSGPYVFCLQAGTYQESDAIRPNPNVTLHGLGHATDVVIRSTADYGIFVKIGANNVKIHGLTVDGGNSASAMTKGGIYFNGNSGGQMTAVRIENLGGPGLALNQADDFSYQWGSIKNIGLTTLRSHSLAVWIHESDSVDILNISVHGNRGDNGRDHAVTCYESSNVTIDNIKSYYSGSAGIGAQDCQGMSITNNEVYYGSEFGIDIGVGNSNIEISDNYVSGLNYTAIVLTDHDWSSCGHCGTPPDSVNIQDNEMVDNNRSGFWDGACDSGDDIDAIILINNPTNVNIGPGNTTDNGPVSCYATLP